MLCTFKPNIGNIGRKLRDPIRVEKKVDTRQTNRRTNGRRTDQHRISSTDYVSSRANEKLSCCWFETLQWRHNEHDGVRNHQPHHCLLNRWFRRRSKKTSKLRVTGLCAGNSLGTGEFPAQMGSNAENVSICWRHHNPMAWYYSNAYRHSVFLRGTNGISVYMGVKWTPL